jgi:hypothetical protein
MDAKVWTRDEIVDLLAKRDRAVEKALVVLFDRQTADEQATDATAHHNRVGFNGVDAKFGSSLARQVRDGRGLSNRQMAAARRMVAKYVGQLVGVANAHELMKARETAQAA